ncbi:MAG TPA: TetR family transcriptional regulator [Actinomycetes bacterium]
MTDAVKRPYRSTRRREQASETRRRILLAAHDLFVSQGYGRTTIAEVAGAAGVAVETVYAAYRNKLALLRQVWYATFRGDDQDIRLLDRPEIRAVLAEPDLATRLRAHAVVMTPVFRRITPLFRALQGAATSEPAAAAMLAEFDQRRLDAASHYARAAAATGRLAVSEQECRDLLAATMDGALWHRLVAERGWSEDRYAQLLGTMWVAALVR